MGTCHGVIKRIAPEAEIIDITHGIPRDVHPAGGAGVREHDRLHARRRSPRDRRSRRGRAATASGAARSRRSAVRRAGQRAAHAGSEPPRASRRPTSSPTPSTRSSRSRARSMVAISSPPPPRTSPRRHARGARAARRPRKPRSARPPRARGRRGRDPRNAALRRQLWQHRAQPRPGRRRGPRDRRRGRASSSSSRGERYYAVMARTFADARPGDVILYEDSYKNMSLAISRGSAARMLHASPGQVIRHHDRDL